MPEFAVSEEKNRWLRQKMADIGVREEDLEESFVRSSGKGGQHVNKTSSCVQLKHKPTGLTATCMRERSQSVNRFLARRELLEHDLCDFEIGELTSEEDARFCSQQHATLAGFFGRGAAASRRRATRAALCL